jgi:ketosteroid isomerase-like protein
MSQENLELARQVLDALGAHDAERLVELSQPKVEWHSFFALSERGVYRGHDGTHRFMRDVTDAFDIAHAEVDDALGIGHIVVLVGRVHFRGKGSGADSTAAAGWVLTFRGGKLLSFRAFREPERALQAVGLED